jgi:DinB family protein
MTLPLALEALWNRIEGVRGKVLQEARGLSQFQADWRPGAADWSIGEILHHLAVAETHTGKLTTKLVREAEATGVLAPYPAEIVEFAELPPVPVEGMQAPPAVQPERDLPVTRLLADLAAIRARSRQSLEKIAALDPRRLTFKHFAFGELNIAQWWMLQAFHDATHLEQMRAVKASPGFPAA